MTAVAAGATHSLARKSDGTVLAWGNNLSGQLGNSGVNTEAATPVQVKGPNGQGALGGVTTVAAGYYHSLAIGQRAATQSDTGLNFGKQAVNTVSAAKSFTITNTGLGTFTLDEAKLTGATADFPLSDGCNGVAVIAGASCTASVYFKPTDASTRQASLSITSTASGSPHKVTLSGEGTVASPPPPPPGGGSPGVPGGTYTLAQ